MSVVSVAVLFAGVGSIVPAGIATLAVLVSVPAAASAGTRPLTVKMIEPPAATVTSSSMSPVPAPVPQLEPSAVAHDQVTPVRTVGTASTTRASTIVDGPAFATMTV
jgi:hypothetical protein